MIGQIKSVFKPVGQVFLGLYLMASATTAFAHSDGQHALSPADVRTAIEVSKNLFGVLKGSWFLTRLTRIETNLNDDGDEVEVRLYYHWGKEKLARYFCGYDAIERLSCDPAFSGPGAL